jgi:hypothetical protein
MGYGKHLANACYTEAFTHYRVATKLRTKLWGWCHCPMLWPGGEGRCSGALAGFFFL